VVPAQPGLVLTSYGRLANATIANALAYGVDWTSVVDKYFGNDFPAAIHGSNQLDGEFNLVQNVRSLGYDYAKATEILQATGNSDLSLRLYMLSDENLQNFAQVLQQYLKEMGLSVELIVVPGVGNLDSINRELLLEGVPFLTLTLR
jgi:ABC-type transport system substrate-binding protein